MILKKKMKIKNNVIKNIKGFSIIEMMVVIAILSIMILGLVTFFTGGTRAWISGQSQLKAQREARQTIDRMVKEIRLGRSATFNSSESITIHIPELGDTDAYDVTFAKSGRSLFRDNNPL